MIATGTGKKQAITEITELFIHKDSDALRHATVILQEFQRQEQTAINPARMIRFALMTQKLEIASEEVIKIIQPYLGYKQDQSKRYVNCLLANFIHNAAHSAPTAITTKHDASGNGFSVQMQKKILEAMIAENLIVQIPGSQQDGLCASYYPKLKLTHIINSNYVDPLRLSTYKPPLNEIIINRRDVHDNESKDHKVAMSARAFPEVRKHRKNLLQINQHIQSFSFKRRVRTALPTEITCKATDGYIERENIIKSLLHHPALYQKGDGFSYLTELNTVLKRTFNLVDGQALGGRFNSKGGGHYLGMTRQERKNDVLLDGEILPEPDIKSSQYAILYALEGKPCPENVYVYEKGQIEREIMKQLGLVMLNQSNRNYKYATMTGLVDMALSCQLPLDAVDYFSRKYEKLRDEFLIHNEAIAHHFGRGMVYELMRVEAEVLERTMLALVEMGIPFLPVHDSIKVKGEHVNFVCQVMEQVSVGVLGVPLSVSV